MARRIAGKGRVVNEIEFVPIDDDAELTLSHRGKHEENYLVANYETNYSARLPWP